MNQYMYSVTPTEKSSACIHILSLDLELAEDPNVFVDFLPLVLHLREKTIFHLTLAGCAEYKDYVMQADLILYSLGFDVVNNFDKEVTG